MICIHFGAQGGEGTQGNIALQTKTYYNDVIETKCKNREQKYTDLNDGTTIVSSVTVLEKPTEFNHKLQDLYDKCCSAKDVVKGSQSQVYPDYLATATYASSGISAACDIVGP